MLDTLTPENWRDFSQRYARTFGWYTKESGEKVPVYIHEVHEGHVVFHGLDGREFEGRAGKGVAFQFAPLTRRLHVGNDGYVYVINRRPARQYSRGISPNNTFIYRLTGSGLKTIPVGTASMKILLADEGTKITNGVKLSKAFCLIDRVLYAYECVVGSLVNNTIFLNADTKSLVQEVRDAVRDSKLTYKVE